MYCLPNLLRIESQASHPAHAAKLGLELLIRIAEMRILCITLNEVDQRDSQPVKLERLPTKSLSS